MPSEHTNPTEGYDAPRTVRDDDDLDRWRFAAGIARTVRDTPTSWSVRIGVFGRWGEGKSTVLRFICQMLEKDGDVVLWFNPWAVRGWDELWRHFSKTLYAGLESAGLRVENGWKSKARSLSKWLEKWKPAAEAVSTTHSFAKATQGVTFAALQAWLHTDTEELHSIRAKLGDRRIVVLVDDLDRTDPKLVPQLLLAFRDLLDVPGFTFVLAFDEDIVGAALKEYHPAWTDANDFLEKILDFRFHLPPVTGPQSLTLLKRSLATYCSFVPMNSITGIQDLVPRNPRKLKSLVRGFSALRGDISRHDADELSWIDIWLSQLIKCESQTVFARLVGEDVLEQETGLAYWLHDHSTGETSRPKSDPHSALKKQLEEWGITDPKTQLRLIELIEAVRARGGLQFRYSAELAIRPHRVTWREFRQFRSSWRLDKAPATIQAWLTKQAENQSASVEEVSVELFQALLAARQRELVRASEVTSAEEQAVTVALAQEILIIIEQFLLNLNYITPRRFKSAFEHCMGWIGFGRNAADRNARTVERVFVFSLLQSARIAPMAALESLRPWAFDQDNFHFEPSIRELRQSFLSDCLDVIVGACTQEALSLFLVDGGLRQLRERGRKSGVAYCLFSPVSPLWRKPQYDQLLSLLADASCNSFIYDNCVDLVELLEDGKNSRLELPKAYFDEIYQCHDFLGALWKAITSRTIQYRMLGEYLRIHRQYVEAGVPKEHLPLTPELKSRQEELVPG